MAGTGTRIARNFYLFKIQIRFAAHVVVMVVFRVGISAHAIRPVDFWAHTQRDTFDVDKYIRVFGPMFTYLI